MFETKINLSTASDIRNFINAIVPYNCSFNILSEADRYIINAKSIMGIFTLDLSKPLSLHIKNADENQIERIMNDIKPFLHFQTV